MSEFTEKSIIYKAMDHQEARELMETIVDTNSLVSIEGSDVMSLENNARREKKRICCVYNPSGSDEVLEAWAKKYPEATNILLFTEGNLFSGNDAANTLSGFFDHDVSIIFGIADGNPNGGRLAGVFV